MIQQLLAALRRRRRASEATADDNEAVPSTPTPTYQTFDLLYPRPFSSSDKEPQVELSEAEALLLAMTLDD